MRDSGIEQLCESNSALCKTSSPSLQSMPICPFFSLRNHFLVHRFSMKNLHKEREREDMTGQRVPKRLMLPKVGFLVELKEEVDKIE